MCEYAVKLVSMKCRLTKVYSLRHPGTNQEIDYRSRNEPSYMDSRRITRGGDVEIVTSSITCTPGNDCCRCSADCRNLRKPNICIAESGTPGDREACRQTTLKLPGHHLDWTTALTPEASTLTTIDRCPNKKEGNHRLALTIATVYRESRATFYE